jgi:hypothetical protein
MMEYTLRVILGQDCLRLEIPQLQVSALGNNLAEALEDLSANIKDQDRILRDIPEPWLTKEALDLKTLLGILLLNRTLDVVA